MEDRLDWPLPCNDDDDAVALFFFRPKETSQWDFCGVMPVKCFVVVHMKRRQGVAAAADAQSGKNTPSRATTTQKTDEKKNGFSENKIATLLKCEKFFGAARVLVHVSIVSWRWWWWWCRVQPRALHFECAILCLANTRALMLCRTILKLWRNSLFGSDEFWPNYVEWGATPYSRLYSVPLAFKAAAASLGDFCDSVVEVSHVCHTYSTTRFTCASSRVPHMDFSQCQGMATLADPATNLNLYKSTARMLSLVERRRFWMLAFACCTMMLIRVSRQWFTSRRHSHTHTHNFKQIVRSRLDAHTLPPFKLFCCGLCNERSLQMVSRAFTILLNYSIPIYLN